MKKVGISTVYTGFNYGSCLQAYASQTVLANMGYDASLIWYKDGLVKGRDIRLKKIFGMGLRTIWRPKLFKKTFLTYKNSLKKELENETKEYFLQFQRDKLNVKKMSWNEMKKYASDKETLACVCGSDQIWNSTNIYIDPIFYLRFAPKNKRVAYAPSFGKNFVPEYNKNIIKKYISDFEYISVREEQGTKIVNDLINREVNSVLDPTLLLNNEQWMNGMVNKMELPEKYILVYFLDKPTEVALAYIKEISSKYSLPIIAIPYKFDELSKIDNLSYKNAGPEQFLNLVNNAEFVCTDSFHGTAFSINFNVPFYIFQRNYGTAVDQSSRIVSLLEKLKLDDRFVKGIHLSQQNKAVLECTLNYEEANSLLKKEREKSINYLKNAFCSIEESN